MYARAGCRNPRSSRYRFMPGIKNLPDHWNQQISTQQPDRHQAKHDSDNEWDWSSRVHVFGTRSEKKGVQGVQGVQGEEEWRRFGEERLLSIYRNAWEKRPPSTERLTRDLLVLDLILELLQLLELLELLLCYLLFANELSAS